MIKSHVATNKGPPAPSMSLVDSNTIDDVSIYVLWITLGSILLRDGLSANVLNLAMPYAAPGGSIIVKIHPGSYGIILMGLLAAPEVFSKTPVRKNPLAAAALILFIVVLLLLLYLLVHGGASGIGYLVDSTLVYVFGLCAVARLSPRQRLFTAKAILMLLMLNALVALTEFVLRQHILPFPHSMEVFRSAGLFGHPLLLGIISVASLPCIFLLPLAPAIRWSLVAILSAAVVTAQARVATLLTGCFVALGTTIQLRLDLNEGRLSATAVFVIVCLAFLAVPFFILAAIEFGLLERLLSGFNDSSTSARIDIYRIFDFVSRDELLFGIGPERALFITQNVLKIYIIESPLVLWIAQFGLVWAAIFIPALIIFFLSLAVGAPLFTKLAVAGFLILALSLNALAVKGPSGITAIALIFISATVPRRGYVLNGHLEEPLF